MYIILHTLTCFLLRVRYPVTDLLTASLTVKENKENRMNYTFFFFLPKTSKLLKNSYYIFS